MSDFADAVTYANSALYVRRVDDPPNPPSVLTWTTTPNYFDEQILPYPWDLRLKGTETVVGILDEDDPAPSWVARILVRLLGLEWHRRTKAENIYNPYSIISNTPCSAAP
jgi:hypothetical protein